MNTDRLYLLDSMSVNLSTCVVEEPQFDNNNMLPNLMQTHTRVNCVFTWISLQCLFNTNDISIGIVLSFVSQSLTTRGQRKLKEATPVSSYVLNDKSKYMYNQKQYLTLYSLFLTTGPWRQPVTEDSSWNEHLWD